MRRSRWLSALAVFVLIMSPAAALAQSESPGESPGPSGSLPPGGNLTIDVPDGAAPAGTTVSVVTHVPSERPDELKSVPTTLAFYEIQPADVTFSAPATVTRTVGFGEVGIDHYDPLFDGLIVGSLFTRATDGTWSWLKDAAVGSGPSRWRLHDHRHAPITAGPSLPPSPARCWSRTRIPPAPRSARPSASKARCESTRESRADIEAVSGTTSDESIAKAGDSYDVAFFDRAEGIEFTCLGPGTVQYQTTFTISDVGDVGPLTSAINLAGTDVAVTQIGPAHLRLATGTSDAPRSSCRHAVGAQRWYMPDNANPTDDGGRQQDHLRSRHCHRAEADQPSELAVDDDGFLGQLLA